MFIEESEGSMRRFLGIAVPGLVVCLLAANVAVAQGQGRRGGFGMFGGMMVQPAALLPNPQVQKELKLNEEQIAKIKEITDALRPQPGAARPDFQNMSEEERREFFAEMQKKNDEAGKKATEVLTDTQKGRFKQIQLWVQGTGALVQNEELAKTLKITDDQKEALKTITEESGKKQQELGRGSFGPGVSDEDRAKAREQMTALRTETEAECMAVLTDDQKAQFEKLKGPKFELDMSQLFNRRGRGGRPGGNNNQ
jgi:Spy/CpxP family protein refolding chaperone